MDNIDEIQERFIYALSAIRRKKKITQKDIDLAQKVISRVENGEADPRLSTIITYLRGIGYDINDLFKEESVMKRPNILMVEHLNLKLEKEGTCLRYVETRSEGDMKTYELRVSDKYIDYGDFGMNLNISKEFEDMVRAFFKRYGAEDIGFSNTVATIFAVV